MLSGLVFTDSGSRLLCTAACSVLQDSACRVLTHCLLALLTLHDDCTDKPARLIQCV